MASKTTQIEDLKLQQQIQRIFSCVVLNQKLQAKVQFFLIKALQKARQLMMNNVKQISSQALDRSICRDGSIGVLDSQMLLQSIHNRGDIYKFKIARTLLMNKTISQVRQKSQRDVKGNIKQAQFDDKDD